MSVSSSDLGLTVFDLVTSRTVSATASVTSLQPVLISEFDVDLPLDVVPYIRGGIGPDSTSRGPTGPTGRDIFQDINYIRLGHQAVSLLEQFPTSSIHAFVHKLCESSGTRTSQAELLSSINLFRSVEIGQRRLARRLSRLLASADTDDPAALLGAVVEVCQVLQQIRTRSTGPTDTSVFDDAPDPLPELLDDSASSPIIINSSSNYASDNYASSVTSPVYHSSSYSDISSVNVPP